MSSIVCLMPFSCSLLAAFPRRAWQGSRHAADDEAKSARQRVSVDPREPEEMCPWHRSVQALLVCVTLRDPHAFPGALFAIRWALLLAAAIYRAGQCQGRVLVKGTACARPARNTGKTFRAGDGQR